MNLVVTNMPEQSGPQSRFIEHSMIRLIVYSWCFFVSLCAWWLMVLPACIDNQ